MCFGGGGGGSTTNTSTSYTSNLPEYARPYYEDMMARAEAVSQEPYQPYDGQRIANFTDPQLTAQQGAADLYSYGNPSLDAAQNYASLGTSQAMGMSYDPNQIDVSNMYLNDPTGDFNRWNQGWQDQYMSPYMDEVVARAQENAILQDQRAALDRNAAYTQAGAFGGSRQAVSDYLSQEGLLRQLGDIYATGRQSAFENAQNMFTSDEQRRLATQQLGLQAGQTNLNAAMQQQMANEANRQFSSSFGLDAAKTGLAGSELLGNLGQQGQESELQRISALENVGAQQQGLQQLLLDQAYTDFLNQRDYPQQQLGWLAGIMGGVPVTPNQTTYSQAPGPNPLSQLAGLGIAGVGLSNLLG